MELTLFYIGSLKPQTKRKNAQEKQNIRTELHKQLKELWKRAPFTPDQENFYKQVGDFNFLPLVVEGRNEIAEINVTMLRPTPHGSIVDNAGDLDNRIKTLLDSLRMPNTEQELPKEAKPKRGQNPFYCLLEDDKLITKLAVSTGRLLIPNNNSKKSHVHLLIKIKIKQVEPEFGHMIASLG